MVPLPAEGRAGFGRRVSPSNVFDDGKPQTRPTWRESGPLCRPRPPSPAARADGGALHWRALAGGGGAGAVPAGDQPGAEGRLHHPLPAAAPALDVPAGAVHPCPACLNRSPHPSRLKEVWCVLNPVFSNVTPLELRTSMPAHSGRLMA